MVPTVKPRRLIVNADDFGFSEGVTEGILRAHREGIVTSTTVTTNMPAAAAAIERLCEAPGLGVGVHLNVTQGPPLSIEGKALCGPGGVMARTAVQLMRAVVCRPWLLKAVEAECDAQVRRLVDRGIRPTHLDSHRHVHGFGPVFARVARVARRYDIPFVRWYGEPARFRRAPAERKQRRISRLLNVFAAALPLLGRDLRGTRGTLGVARTGRIDADWLAGLGESLGPGTWELMTHPGAGDDLPAELTRLRDSRRTELRALCDPRVKAELARRGVERIHYGQL